MIRNKQLKQCIYWGATALAVLVLFLALFKLPLLTHGFGVLVGILMPFVYGFVLAYLLIPVYNWCMRLVLSLLRQTKLAGSKPVLVKKLARGVSTLVSLIFTLMVLAAFLGMIIPQVIESIFGIVDTLPQNVERWAMWITQLLHDNPDLEKTALDLYNQGITFVQNWMQTDLVPQAKALLIGLSSGVLGTLTVLKNILIGVIIAVYVLNSKETFAAQAKKMTYSCFKPELANKIIDNVRFTHQVFGGFISGKLLDSLIIGILCFIIMSLFEWPYAMLISVIIGVTNIIPFFGPFIGAIPSAFLILLVDPMTCLYFIIFVFILQQFDGNILGPKILGDSTGLPSFWVLFAILLFGGVFGFIGMVIGVPVFAVLYSLISRLVDRSLRKKALSTNTADYLRLEHIEPKEKTFVREKKRK